MASWEDLATASAESLWPSVGRKFHFLDIVCDAGCDKCFPGGLLPPLSVETVNFLVVFVTSHLA